MIDTKITEGAKIVSTRLGGRQKGTPNKVTAELREIAQPYAPEAIDTLVKIMRKSKYDQCRIMAADKLLDRGFGKATEHVKHSGTIEHIDLTRLSDTTLDEIEALVESAHTESVGHQG